jgi:DUF1365 family protein
VKGLLTLHLSYFIRHQLPSIFSRIDGHTVPSASANMGCNGSSVNGDETENHVTPDSPSGVLVSSIIVSALALSWTSRFLFDRKAAVQDAVAVAVFSSTFHRRYLNYFISHAFSNNSVLVSLTTSIAIVFTITALRNGILAEWFGTSPAAEKEQTKAGLPPLMIPCRTTHTRFSPAKHSFSYSYLFVGIPVGWSGRAGTILSADSHCAAVQGNSRRTWFGVEAEDYLERGNHPGGLRGKLFEYLRNQGVAPEQYSRALLVTAPRFLGFSFNPVSFWYLYNEANFLQAMVVEVNNTFDERRMYFMERRKDYPAPEEGAQHFKHSWEKDFHVSPFNSRDGSYSLRAADPYANATGGDVNVDCNIVLKNADQKAKMVARVFSTDSAIDATSMARWQTLVFVLQWWWVGLVTHFRILREARILWIKKLQVFYRPEVLKTSIGRQESSEEAQLEPCFRLVLGRLVQCSQNGVQLNYVPAAGPRRGTLESIGVSKSDPTRHSQRTIEIRVLTPAFYSQFVRFRDYGEAFGKLCFDVPDSAKHVYIADRVAFLDMLSRVEKLNPGIAKVPFRWRLLAWLRAKKSIYSLLLTTMSGGYPADGCVFDLSQLDMLIMNNCNYVSRKRYFRTVATLLISDRLAFGWTEILRFYGVLIWAFLVYVATSSGHQLLSPKPLAGGTGTKILLILRILSPHLRAFGMKLI